MSYVVLARKWRPKRFAEMVGQEHVLRALSNALDSGKVHHAFLFTGTRGVGKTTVARILAKSLNCETNGVSSNPCGVCAACKEIDEGRFVDLIEVDAASRTKVDDTRDMLDNVQYAPTRGRYKVYLIDEVHMLSTHSFNALLKTLEEPPPHVKFLLATTDPQKLPVTVLSRCLQFSLKRLPAALIGERLKFIATAENLSFEPAAIALLARAADGSMRDALSLMDQLIAFGGGAVNEANARSMLGTIDRGHVGRLVEALSRGDGAALLAEVRELDRDAPDYDRALVDLATLAAAHSHRADRAGGGSSGRGVRCGAADAACAGNFARRRAALLSDRPRGPPRLDHGAGTAHRLRNDIAANVGISPGCGRRNPRSRPVSPTPRLPVQVQGRAVGASAAAGTNAVSARATSRPRSARTRTAAVDAARLTSIDAANWPAIVEAAGLSAMVRQLALNCVPAGFEHNLLTLKLDQAASDRRTRPIEEKLVQGFRSI